MEQEVTLAQRAGENLKRLLEEKGWSQELAEAKISGTYNNGRSVRRWIKNGIDKISTIEYIAQVIEVDVMEFFK